jgi:hypothetical protein
LKFYQLVHKIGYCLSPHEIKSSFKQVYNASNNQVLKMMQQDTVDLFARHCITRIYHLYNSLWQHECLETNTIVVIMIMKRALAGCKFITSFYIFDS